MRIIEFGPAQAIICCEFLIFFFFSSFIHQHHYNAKALMMLWAPAWARNILHSTIGGKVSFVVVFLHIKLFLRKQIIDYNFNSFIRHSFTFKWFSIVGCTISFCKAIGSSVDRLVRWLTLHSVRIIPCYIHFKRSAVHLSVHDWLNDQVNKNSWKIYHKNDRSGQKSRFLVVPKNYVWSFGHDDWFFRSLYVT